MSLIKRTIERVGMLKREEVASIIDDTELASNELHITIWNDKGEIVVDTIEKCAVVTEAEIDAMVSLIESGMPARISAYVVTHEPKV
jgi:hypothetical protein